MESVLANLNERLLEAQERYNYATFERKETEEELSRQIGEEPDAVKKVKLKEELDEYRARISRAENELRLTQGFVDVANKLSESRDGNESVEDFTRRVFGESLDVATAYFEESIKNPESREFFAGVIENSIELKKAKEAEGKLSKDEKEVLESEKELLAQLKGLGKGKISDDDKEGTKKVEQALLSYKKLKRAELQVHISQMKQVKVDEKEKITVVDKVLNIITFGLWSLFKTKEHDKAKDKAVRKIDSVSTAMKKDSEKEKKLIEKVQDFRNNIEIINANPRDYLTAEQRHQYEWIEKQIAESKKIENPAERQKSFQKIVMGNWTMVEDMAKESQKMAAIFESGKRKGK